jgi:cyclopropane fatty-acyl-phospholipid synthase-like methyltransferase
MLREARDNCEHQGISNIRLIKADGSDVATLGPVDLVHSFIVFQHISPRWGEAIFRRLIPLVNPNGIGVVHFTYAAKHRRSVLRRLIGRMCRHIRGLFVPVMEMNVYNLNRLVGILQEYGIRHLHIEMTDHDFYGVILFFQKMRTSEGKV